MCKVLVRALFPALILITISVPVMPAYPAEPKTVNEQIKSTGDRITDVEGKIKKLAGDAEDAQKRLDDTEKKTKATKEELDAYSVFSHMTLTIGGAVFALLAVFVIAYFSRKDVKKLLEKIYKNTQCDPRPAIVHVDPRTGEPYSQIDAGPAIVYVDPKIGAPFGGLIIKIRGANFYGWTRVWIHDQLARVEKIEKTGGRYWEISAEIPAIDLKEKEKSVKYGTKRLLRNNLIIYIFLFISIV